MAYEALEQTMQEDEISLAFQRALEALKQSEGALIINNLTINIVVASGHNAKVNSQEVGRC